MPRSPHYISPPESDGDSDIIVEESSVESSHEDTISYEDEMGEADEYSIDTEECDAILREDYDHSFSDKEDKHYYIGSCWLHLAPKPAWTLANSISPAVFFRHSITDVMHYLWLFSLFRLDRPHIDILQLHITPQGQYTVLIKTFWLRLVQRRWRQIYRERQDILRKRRSILALRYREVRGKYPQGMNALPNIIDMFRSPANLSSINLPVGDQRSQHCTL